MENMPHNLPHGNKYGSVNTNLMGYNGAVVTNHWLASSVGKTILSNGGNAFDAACAVSFALGVVEPQNSGVGGDGYIMLFEKDKNKVSVINGTGPAPEYSDRIKDTLYQKGIKSSSVPGLVSAVLKMHEMLGQLDLEKCIKPSIEMCTQGVPLSDGQSASLISESQINRFNSSMKIWGSEKNQYKKAGDKIINLDLAKTLGKIIEEGHKGFYEGEIADQIVNYSNQNDGYLSINDLKNFSAEIQEPIFTDYRNNKIFESPPNSSGVTLLQQLNIIENFSKSDLEPLSPYAIHIMSEAKRLAFYDREKFLADPKFVDVPLDKLLSKTYANELSKRISLDNKRIPNEELELSYQPDSVGDTTYFAILDQYGNAVSQLQSIQTAWGSGDVVDNTGILMNNRMTYWHLDPNHINKLIPGKRVRHTMNPVMVFSGSNQELKIICGTPGADTQVQTNMQVLSALLDHDLTVGQAVSLPRWTHYQNLTESTAPHSTPEFISLEENISNEAKDFLKKKGHDIKEVLAWGGKGSEGMIQISSKGLISAAVDPRRDGQALVW